jgi:thioesterase domain-containing protein
MSGSAAHGADYLQRKILAEFPLARHIGIEIESADDGGLVLRAPFEPNANYKGTAFGGSQFCVAVLAGWAWVTRHLAVHQLAADTVIQQSTIRYLAPLQADLRATVAAPPVDRSEKFRKMLRRGGHGRIVLQVDILDGPTLATRFEGVFAALTREERT